MKTRQPIKPRNLPTLGMILHTKPGPMQDRRTKRKGNRSQQRQKAIREYQ